MENLMIPPSLSRPPVIIPSKQESLTTFSEKPTKSTVKYSKNLNPKIPDTHFNYFCRNGRLSKSIRSLDPIGQSSSKVRANASINLLQSCIDYVSMELGRQLHARIDLVEVKDPFVETKLVSMYAKCGSLHGARELFDEMQERNLYTWSAMIGACSRGQRWKEVVELLFLMMNDWMVPDDFLCPKFLEACANCGDVWTRKLIHSLVIRLGMVCCTRVSNSVLAVYAKCGRLALARRYFEGMDDRDTVAWNTMISGYCQKGDSKEAHRLFNSMREKLRN